MKSFHFKSAALATAMLGLAAPAFAQDICAGAGNGGQWIGGTEDMSDIASADSYREQMALVLGGNEYVSLFSLSAPAEIRVEAEGRGAGDPLIDLLGADGSIILSDDDSGGNGAARGEVSLEAGTYCMLMQSYDGAPMTAFVRIGRTEHEALTAGAGGGAVVETPDVDVDNGDSGDSGGNSAVIESNLRSENCGNSVPLGTLSGDMLTDTRSVDDNGFYSFTLGEPTAITITAENEDADPLITLYDRDLQYFDENDDFDGLNAQLEFSTPLPAGAYCLELEALNDTSLPITVSISEYDPVAALAALYASGEAAPPLDGSVPFTDVGTLENRIRKDDAITSDVTWYTVNIDEPGLLLVEAISVGGTGDPWVIVYDDLGREVAYNDDAGAGLDSLAAARVNIGTYIVGVADINDDASGFGRILFERFVSAR